MGYVRSTDESLEIATKSPDGDLDYKSVSRRCMMKRLSMIKLEAETRKLPDDLFDYAMDNDSAPTVIEDVEATPENIARAKAWLATKKSSAEYWRGYALNFYMVTVYAIEYYTADADGEFLEGSDYDIAEEASMD